MTLQGESIYAGWPAVFIRLTGCNLKCAFCDTEWGDETDPYLSVDEIINKVRQVQTDTCRLYVITGGEPLRQDMSLLVPALFKLGNGRTRIQFETAGTIWQDILLHDDVSIVVSPKTPKINSKIYLHAAAFKYIIRQGQNAENDGLPVMSTQRQGQRSTIARPRPGAPVYLSPCDELDTVLTKANEREVVRMAMRHGYIAGMQMHKIWGVP
jgi:organic radical activating enzyme